jgi:hypothetical protein
MNTISGLVALLQYVDQLSADLQIAVSADPAERPSAEQIAARKTRITKLLDDAKADLDAITQAIGHEFGGGADPDLP